MKWKSAVLFTLLMALAILGGCQTDEPASPLSASLSELSGLVQVKQAGREVFEEAALNSVLTVNGQVQTGDNGRVRLDLSSGTIIRVAPSSSFVLASNEEVEGGLFTKIKLEAGKIFVILNGGQADVETPSGVASVRGSYMKVEVDPATGDIYITCLEGNCSVINPDGVEVNFTNGQRAALFHQNEDGSWSAPLLGDMTPDEFQDWLDNNPEAKELFEQGIARLTEIAATEEATEQPTESPTEAPTAEPSGGSGSSCSQPQEPSNSSVLGKIGQVNFSWTEQPGAAYYVLTFVNEDGSMARIQTMDPGAQFYIEVLPLGGNYEWFVTPFGSDGTALCTSASMSFSKPKADPTQKPKPEDKPEKTEPAPIEDPYCKIDPCYSASCPGYDPYYCGN